MFEIVELVRKGRDNPFSLSVNFDGQPVDFSSASSFELNVGGVSITAGIVGNSTGELTFNIQDEDVPIGTHIAELIVYDPGHLDGQVIVDKHSDKLLKIKFV